MKKKFVLLGTGGAALAVALAAMAGGAARLVSAEETYDWNHYSGVAENMYQSGSKEYWVDCKTHEHVFEEPTLAEGETIAPVAEPTETFAKTDDRYINAPVTKVPVTSEHVREQVPGATTLAGTTENGHSFAIENEVATYTGYNNGGIDVYNLTDLSLNYSTISFDIKGGYAGWGYSLSFHFIDSKGKDTGKVLSNSTWSTLSGEGWAITNDAGGAIGSTLASAMTKIWLHVTVNFSSYLTSGASLKQLQIFDQVTESKYSIDSISLKNIEFRDSCTHADYTSSAHSDGSHVGEKCDHCGLPTANYVDSIINRGSGGAAYPDRFDYETGVTFDGHKDCLEVKTKVDLQSNGGVAAYYIMYENLITKAIAANKPIMKFHLYLEAPSTAGTGGSAPMLTWTAVGSNKVYVSSARSRQDFNSINLAGDQTLNQNSKITKEDGTALATSGIVPGSWVLLTIDASKITSTAVSFGIGGCYYGDSVTNRPFPVNVYVSSIELAASTAA